MKTYELGVAKSSGNPFIKCLRCNRESYNQNDIDNLFCPNPKCGFHEDLLQQEPRGYDPRNHSAGEK